LMGLHLYRSLFQTADFCIDGTPFI